MQDHERQYCTNRSVGHLLAILLHLLRSNLHHASLDRLLRRSLHRDNLQGAHASIHPTLLEYTGRRFHNHLVLVDINLVVLILHFHLPMGLILLQHLSRSKCDAHWWSSGSSAMRIGAQVSVSASGRGCSGRVRPQFYLRILGGCCSVVGC